MLVFKRVLTSEDEHPFETIEWEKENIEIRNDTGDIIYHCPDAEFPASWSGLARQTVANKYFRESRKTTQRETSAKQMVLRVTEAIRQGGVEHKYFEEKDSIVFKEELIAVLLNQMATFNSPVWFNLGVPGVDNPQCSACFINEIEDSMEGIADLAKKEMMIFKEGSGSGVNMSPIRGSNENIRGGGTASGPLSFMEGFDAFANVILSGGRTRRAARMCVLDGEHPDIMKFINVKSEQEDKAVALAKTGISVDFRDPENVYTYVKHQSSNLSVRLTDEFMKKVRDVMHYGKDAEWELINRTDADPDRKANYISVKKMFEAIAAGAHKCGDPGVQFHDTINDMNTCSNDGEITASNPCFTGNMRLLTAEGYKTFKELAQQDTVSLINHKGNVTKGRVWSTGIKPICRVNFLHKLKWPSIECTPSHVFMLADGSADEVQNLSNGTQVMSYVSTKDTLKHEAPRIESIQYLDEQEVYDFTEPETHWGVVEGIVVHNCGEFTMLKNSACNLASLNLLKYVEENRTLNLKNFKHVVKLMIVAQDILIEISGFPTDEIKQNSKDYRPLGLGYANIGGLLMSWGIPYDGQVGRDLAASITSLLTGTAYLSSMELAEHLGPFKHYENNQEPMEDVLNKQYKATRQLHKDIAGISPKAVGVWREVMGLGCGRKKSVDTPTGFRNCVVTLIAPTGTTGFMMDCATTGCEPDIGLKKLKRLVGGSSMEYVNPTITAALQTLDYSESDIQEIVAFVEEHGHVEGSILHTTDYKVFDCAYGAGERALSMEAHVDFVAAIQPFVSGAISKTFAMPHTATVQDVQNTFLRAWEKGVKSITVYREGSKLSEPLRVRELRIGQEVPLELVRKKLPQDRPSDTHAVTISGSSLYLTVGKDPETLEPKELFIRISKYGATVGGLLDSYATLLSKALQYGLPLEAALSHMMDTQFSPSGVTNNPQIPMAKSIMDYIAKWMLAKYTGNKTAEPTAPVVTKDAEITGEVCAECGALMIRTGATCQICSNCAVSTGVCG